MENASEAKPRVELEIGQGESSWGKLVFELDEQRAPETTRNFLRYVGEGFYQDTVFHRVIPTFMIQGGGYAADLTEKDAGLHKPVVNEAAQGLSNERGTIAMARTSDPHSATSQFFINVKDNAFLDHPGQDGWGYCAFGRVVEGLELLDRIKDVETQPNPDMGGEGSQPVEPPVIKAVRRL
ncbi:MAG: peptidylprolyl isomerase [Planctomycetota bacterium]